MKDKEHILLLLQLVKFNGNINYLLELGYTHIQILNMLNIFNKKGIVINENDTFLLSSEGELYLNRLCKELKKRGLYKYLSPSFKNKIKKISINEIFIPLSFVRKKGLFSLSHENVKIDESSIDKEFPF